MENSPFQKLSAELRNHIWEQTVTDPGPISINKTCGIFDVSVLPAQAPITRTCKQIRAESLSMYYVKNRFPVYIECGGGSDATVDRFGIGNVSEKSMALHWLRDLKEEHLKLIPSLEVHINICFTIWLLGWPIRQNYFSRLASQLKSSGYEGTKLKGSVWRGELGEKATVEMAFKSIGMPVVVYEQEYDL